MDIQNLLSTFFKVQEYQKGVYEVRTPYMIFANVPFIFVIEKVGNAYKITDKKMILTFLSKLYDLSSGDVKACIRDVLKENRISLSKGEMFVISENELEFPVKLANFLICAGQLIRMQAFFDEPEN